MKTIIIKSSHHNHLDVRTGSSYKILGDICVWCRLLLCLHKLAETFTFHPDNDIAAFPLVLFLYGAMNAVETTGNTVVGC